ncbi:unnamed protein product [Leptidea sinapis]|uniref:Uncharacterized protein n=1 Tax=Leptidea sinapis TaxID=189913 RepID=A0A5E4QB57_9NEOP|nr:unnamed protein product [Leptidea sinapis]
MELHLENLFTKLKIGMHNQTKEITENIMVKIDEKLKPLLEENTKLKQSVKKLENLVEKLEEEKKSYSDRIALVKLQFSNQQTINILQIYMPTSDYEDAEIINIYNKLSTILEQADSRTFIIQVDFNINAPILRAPALHEAHANGAHPRQLEHRFEPLRHRLAEKRGELLVVEYLQVTT